MPVSESTKLQSLCILIYNHAHHCQDAPPPSSTQYPFSSTGTIFEPLQERESEQEGQKLKQVGWENDVSYRFLVL